MLARFDLQFRRSSALTTGTPRMVLRWVLLSLTGLLLAAWLFYRYLLSPTWLQQIPRVLRDSLTIVEASAAVTLGVLTFLFYWRSRQQESLNHPEVATSLMNLGVFTRSTGDNEAARRYYERALHAYESALGPDHPNVAMALTNLANLLKDLGEFDQARALYDRALSIRESALGPDHPDVAYTVLGLASLEDQMGNLDSARSHVARALEIQQRAFGAVHPWLAATWEDYSDLSRRLGDTVEAERGAARASEIRQQLEGGPEAD